MEDQVERAIGLCRAGDWRRGRDELALLSRRVSQNTRLPSQYYSYLGYCVARFDHQIEEAVRLCEHAIALDPESAEAHLNLARVHKLGHRRYLGIRALRKGLDFDPQNDDLQDLHLEYGVRNRRIIPFLSRRNSINVYLGRLRHRMTGVNDSEDL